MATKVKANVRKKPKAKKTSASILDKAKKWFDDANKRIKQENEDYADKGTSYEREMWQAGVDKLGAGDRDGSKAASRAKTDARIGASRVQARTGGSTSAPKKAVKAKKAATARPRKSVPRSKTGRSLQANASAKKKATTKWAAEDRARATSRTEYGTGKKAPTAKKKKPTKTRPTGR